MTINIVLPLLDKGFDINYIENSQISDVLDYWLSIQDSNKFTKAVDWFVEQEMEMEREINSDKTVQIGNETVTLKPTSINFQLRQERRKRYKC